MYKGAQFNGGGENQPDVENQPASEIATDKVFYELQDHREASENQEERTLEDEQFIYESTKDAAEYIRQNNFKDIVLADRGARAFATALRAYWEIAYPGEKPPQIYFLNPQALKEEVQAGKNQKELQEKFKREHPFLFKDREEPIFVFDVCAHKGETLRSLEIGLERAGFKDVYFGLMFDDRSEEDRENFPMDYTFEKEERQKRGCYPFNFEAYLRKGKLLHSENEPDEKKIERMKKVVDYYIETLKIAEDLKENSDAHSLFLRDRMKKIPRDDFRELYRIFERMNPPIGTNTLDLLEKVSDFMPDLFKADRERGIKTRQEIKEVIKRKFKEKS